MQFVLFLLLGLVWICATTPIVPSTTTIVNDIGLGDYCDSDTNCVSLINNARCLNSVCDCQEGYVLNGRFDCIEVQTSTIPTTSTLIYDSGLGDYCDSNINCFGLINNAHCLNSKCVCREGYVPNGRFDCIEEGVTTIDSTTSTTIYSDSALGGPCQSNDDCGLVADAICSLGVCACRDGYIATGIVQCTPDESTMIPSTTTEIIHYDSLLGGSCESNDNCGGLVANAICSNGVCVCRDGYMAIGQDQCVPDESTSIPSTTSTTIYSDPGIGSPCQSNDECGLVADAVCSDGVCTCRDGYEATEMAQCIPDESTMIPSTTTTTIYYDSLLGGSCESNDNCGGLVANAICSNGVCVCRDGYMAIGQDQCVPDESTSIPSTTTTTIYYDSLLGGSCESNDNCGGLVADAICSNGVCVCRDGYMAIGQDQCVPDESTMIPSTTSTTIYSDPGIGSPCQSNDECGLVADAVCSDGVCACRDGYVATGILQCTPDESTMIPSTTTEIIITDRGLGDPCQSNDECGLVADAVCFDGVCACRDGYVAIGQDQCVPDESTMIPSTTSTTIYSDPGIGSPCQSNDECFLIADGICSDGACACRDGYVATGILQCSPDESTMIPSTTTEIIHYDSLLGGSCESNDNCGGLVANAICSGGVCACRDGYVAIGEDQCVLGGGMRDHLFYFKMKYNCL